MSIPITDKHRRELSPERDFPARTPVRMRYAILSSPRSGSTLLARLLYESRVAGDPLEYFNRSLLALERERSGNPQLSLQQFLETMERRRTSPNGVFGMKVQYSHLLRVHGAVQPNENALRFLRGAGKLIWVRRRDRIAQAVSRAIAARSNVWSSEDSRFQRDPAVHVDVLECVRTLGNVCADEVGWARLIEASKREVLEVYYEDLVARYEEQARAVLRYLGIEQDVPVVPPPPLERQADELNARLRADLCAYLGIAGSATG